MYISHLANIGPVPFSPRPNDNRPAQAIAASADQAFLRRIEKAMAQKERTFEKRRVAMARRATSA
jgi:hypothetical protein